jgi:hypothetical protein
VADPLGLARISAVGAVHRSGHTTIFEAAVILAGGRAVVLPADRAETFVVAKGVADVVLHGHIEMGRRVAGHNGRAVVGRAADRNGHAGAEGVADLNGHMVAVEARRNGREVEGERIVGLGTDDAAVSGQTAVSPAAILVEAVRGHAVVLQVAVAAADQVGRALVLEAVHKSPRSRDG